MAPRFILSRIRRAQQLNDRYTREGRCVQGSRITRHEDGSTRQKRQQIIEFTRLGRRHQRPVGQTLNLVDERSVMTPATRGDPDGDTLPRQSSRNIGPGSGRIALMPGTRAASRMNQNETDFLLAAGNTKAFC